MKSKTNVIINEQITIEPRGLYITNDPGCLSEVSLVLLEVRPLSVGVLLVSVLPLSLTRGRAFLQILAYHLH